MLICNSVPCNNVDGILSVLEGVDDEVINDISEINIFIAPPDVSIDMDEDSGDEYLGGTINNLNRRQLQPEFEISCRKYISANEIVTSPITKQISLHLDKKTRSLFDDPVLIRFHFECKLRNRRTTMAVSKPSASWLRKRRREEKAPTRILGEEILKLPFHRESPALIRSTFSSAQNLREEKISKQVILKSVNIILGNFY
ncbi:hypothetical protein C0J52_02972 [Blattella germanica]|nr:hypothetical protein C0J52_02972 [Blattella germanica]